MHIIHELLFYKKNALLCNVFRNIDTNPQTMLKKKIKFIKYLKSKMSL